MTTTVVSGSVPTLTLTGKATGTKGLGFSLRQGKERQMTSTGSFVMVVGFDGSEHSQTALNWAVDGAQKRSGQIRLVTAWSKPPMAWYPAVLETAAGESRGKIPPTTR